MEDRNSGGKQSEQGYTLRCDRNSAEVIEKKRVVHSPSGQTVCKILQGKGLRNID
jgi:hypothetical protein